MSGGIDARTLYRAVLLGAGLLVVGLLFPKLVTLLVAILVTVLIAIPLAMCADCLERFGVPRALGAFAALLAGLGTLARDHRSWSSRHSSTRRTSSSTGPGASSTTSPPTSRTSPATEPSRSAASPGLPPGLHRHPERFLGPLTSIGFSVVSVLGALVFILITAFYIAVRPQPLIDGILALFPPPRREHGRASWGACAPPGSAGCRASSSTCSSPASCSTSA